jgi:hypothetical protein
MPELPDSDRLFALGIAAMFGSLLVAGCLLVAALADWDAIRSTLFVFSGS